MQANITLPTAIASAMILAATDVPPSIAWYFASLMRVSAYSLSCSIMGGGVSFLASIWYVYNPGQCLTESPGIIKDLSVFQIVLVFKFGTVDPGFNVFN